MGIRFALRRGLQYLLARNVLRVIWYLPLIGIAVTIALHPREPLQEFILHESWWYYAFLFISISLILRYRTAIERWVDKKFFRSVYEEELILSELLEELHQCDVSDDVARVVASKLENALKPNGAAVLYRRDESSRFTVGYAHDAPFALQFCGETNSCLELALHHQRLTPLQVDQREAMVVPIKSPNGQITAALLLGPKKSEEKYSKRDFTLLQAVATQTGLVLEVMALKERVREEGRVRIEVLAKLDKESIQLLMECPTCGLCYSGAETNCRADGQKLVLTLPIERVIDAKYRLDRRIGAGAMGAVYEATDLRLSRLVAVKVLTGRWFGDSIALRRFEREARAAARLQHPNIVPVYDFGSLRGDGAFLVMQRIRGHSWRTELERSGPLSIQRAASWFHQLGDALVAAHASGIIHRDLKPENLLISTNGNGSETVTVLDFGLAKINALDVPVDRLTMENGIVGTLAYMSPEQRAGDRVDARSDVYSCAVVVVEALSGHGPTQLGASQRWLRDSLVWSHPTPPCYQLLRLLHHCMATAPADRLESMTRFQRELIPLLKECPPLSIARAAAVGKTDGLTLPL
jgi:tRNA A-37 threonylcarbamoyl transferase component Bud32